MPSVLERINQRLNTLREMAGDTSWKDPRSPNYDRQWAEDALYHTIGPLTENPTWIERWSSQSEPVPGFAPGGPAPRWTPEEVVFAMAGDPSLAFKPGAKDNPHSPAYGRQGGSPLWRLARRISRHYARDKDMSFISDMYSNGFIPLVRMMQPGFDEGRSPFISYTMKNIESAMLHGVGGTNDAIRAKGGESTTGLKGLRSLLDAQTPEDALAIANQVKGKYQTQKSHDRNPDNAFGPFSSRIYQIANAYAQALGSGNPEQVERVRNHIAQLNDEIDDTETFVPGASTGMGQAISTPDRKTSIGVSSMDVSADEEKGPMAGNIPTEMDDDAGIDPEAVYFMLDIALAHDLTKWLQGDPQLMQAATAMGLKEDKLGRLTAGELRCVIRHLGPVAANYPGKGTPRKAVNIPRDGKGWWQPLEDPELEPIPGGAGMWKSIWTRNGYQDMGPTEISQEFTEEVREFQKLGIPTAREIKAKARVEEVISKVAISKTVTSAVLKLKLIGHVHKGSFGLEESKKIGLRQSGFPLMEDYDPVDRRIISEAFEWAIRKINRKLMEEAALLTAEEPQLQAPKRVIAWSGKQ
jgi:hypothetical protein